MADMSAPVTQTLPQPSGYVPAGLIKTYKPTSSDTLYTTVDNIELIGLHLNQGFIYQATLLDYLAAGSETSLSSLQLIDSKITALDEKVANMQPQVITESISFLLGAFIAIAFVISSKMRY